MLNLMLLFLMSDFPRLKPTPLLVPETDQTSHSEHFMYPLYYVSSYQAVCSTFIVGTYYIQQKYFNNNSELD